jgi:hypothetical protein
MKITNFLKDFIIHFFLFFIIITLFIILFGFVYSFHEELGYQGFVFQVAEAILGFFNFLGYLITQKKDFIFINYFVSILIFSLIFAILLIQLIKFKKK